MKKINTLVTTLLFVSAVVLSNQVNAQTSCPWAKKAGGVNEDFGSAVATDASGNVYQLGNFYSPSVLFGSTTLHNQAYAASNYGGEIFLVKYDSCGNVIWAKQAGGKADAHGTCITTDVAGNVYVGGYSNCDTLWFGTGTLTLLNPGGYPNAFVVKYNSSGVAQWVRGGNGNAQVYVRAIALDASNNVYVTGSFASSVLTLGTYTISNGSSMSSNVFTAKYDNNGNIQWLKGNTSNGATSGDAIGYGIGTDAAGNVYVGGTFGSTYIRFGTDSLPLNSYYDIFVVKYNSIGTEQWLRTAGSSGDDEAFGLAADATGNVYITGQIGASSTVAFGTYSVTNTSNSVTMFLAKYDNTGTAQWAKISQCDWYSYNLGQQVCLDAGGNPNVIGFYGSDSLRMGAVTLYNSSLTDGTGAGDSLTDIFVAKYKANGTLSWARSSGGIGNDYGYALATGLNNSLYITGEFQSPSISFAGITCSLTVGSGTISAGHFNGDAFIANNISTSPITPNICLVSADSIVSNNQYNMIYWDKTTMPTASTFILYREVTSGVYKAIGSQPNSALSQFVDTVRHIGPANGDPNVGSYRYKLQVIDTAGTYSLLSPYHNTVYFINNGGGTFSWNTYTVESASITPVTTFDMVRDNNNTGVWSIVGTVAGTQTSLTDASYTTYSATANWRVNANGFNCTPTLRLSGNNGTDAAKVTSHSNQNNNRQAGINQLGVIGAEFSVYPNPAKDGINLTISQFDNLKISSVEIYNTLGDCVHRQIIKSSNSLIDVSNLAEGVYTINIINNGGMVNKRMVIVR
ncbi:MAG: T9SS type A sorting domain-containing protein [Bacteroidia bacterium]